MININSQSMSLTVVYLKMFNNIGFNIENSLFLFDHIIKINIIPKLSILLLLITFFQSIIIINKFSSFQLNITIPTIQFNVLPKIIL